MRSFGPRLRLCDVAVCCVQDLLDWRNIMPPAAGKAVKDERAEAFKDKFRAFATVPQRRFNSKEDSVLLEFVRNALGEKEATKILQGADGNLKEGDALREAAWSVRERGLLGEIALLGEEGSEDNEGFDSREDEDEDDEEEEEDSDYDGTVTTKVAVRCAREIEVDAEQNHRSYRPLSPFRCAAYQNNRTSAHDDRPRRTP